jgi:hypothetical protein
MPTGFWTTAAREFAQVIAGAALTCLSACSPPRPPAEAQGEWPVLSEPLAFASEAGLMEHFTRQGVGFRLEDLNCGGVKWRLVDVHPASGVGRMQVVCYTKDQDSWRLRAVGCIYESRDAKPRYEADTNSGSVKVLIDGRLVMAMENPSPRPPPSKLP